MKAIRRTVRPFLGMVTAVDPKSIPENSAQSVLNVRLHDGTVARRNGWREVGASVVGSSASLGLFLLKANTGSAANDEYVAIQTVSGSTMPYSVNVSTGAFTKIQNGGVDLALSAGTWLGIYYDGVGYAWKTGAVAYRHSIGDLDQFEPVDASAPAVPTSLALDFDSDLPPVVDTPVSWSGAGGGNLVYDNASGGGANRDTVFTSQTADAITLDLTNASGHPATYEMRLDLQGGTYDWSGKDRIEFVLQWPSTDTDVLKLGFVGATMESGVGLRNGAGSPVDLEMDVTSVFSRTGSTYACYVTAKFPSGATMSDWANTDQLWLSLTLNTSVAGATTLTINQVYPYTAGDGTGLVPSADVVDVQLAIGAYDSVRDVESAEVYASDIYQLDLGKKWFTASDSYLGTSGTASGAAVVSPADSYRLYVRTVDENVWRLVATSDPGAVDVAFDFGQDDIIGFPVRVVKEATPIGNINCACAFQGSVVWGVDAGKTNIRHSRVGLPLALASEVDDIDDLNRGADFTLSDEYTDRPIWIGQAGNALVILGSEAAYVQTGTYPSQRTPCRRLAQSNGVYGARSACRFRDRIGNPGIAYVSKQGHLLFLTATEVDVSGEYGFRIEEIGRAVRDQIAEFLGSGSLPAQADRLCMLVDETENSLVLTYGKRMLVFDTRTLIDDVRPYVRHEFTTSGGATWPIVMADERYGLRAFRSTCAFDEFFRNNNGAALTSDNGSVMPQATWRSKDFSSTSKRRCSHVRVKRDSDDAVSVKVYSDRADRTLAFAAGQNVAKSWIDTQGFEMSYELLFSNTGSPVSELEAVETAPKWEGLDR